MAKEFDPTIGQDTQFGQPGGNDPTKGGRKSTKPLKKLLRDLEDQESTLRIPLDQCEITENEVIIKLPSKEALSLTLIRNAQIDLGWFKQFCLIAGEYAPTKVAETDTEGNDRKIDNKPIVMQYDDMVKDAMERIKQEQKNK